MAASLALVAPDGQETVSLGEIFMPEGLEDIGTGEAVQVRGVNNGTTKLRNISVAVDGPVGQFVQLARDEGGVPGAWAEAGGSIVIQAGEVLPEERFSFWAVTIYSPEDAEGHYHGEFVLKATSVGL
jgi:hypothetical protein